MNQETNDADEAEMKKMDGLIVINDEEAGNLLVLLLALNIQDLIQKVQVFYVFKNSPTKNNDNLQKCIRKESDSEISIRFNSLPIMLDCFSFFITACEKHSLT